MPVWEQNTDVGKQPGVERCPLKRSILGVENVAMADVIFDMCGVERNASTHSCSIGGV
jgi:hypothetical protein